MRAYFYEDHYVLPIEVGLVCNQGYYAGFKHKIKLRKIGNLKPFMLVHQPLL